MRLPLFESLVLTDDPFSSLLVDSCRFACRYLAVCCSKEETFATISPIPLQAINGIGVSGAWWPSDIYHFPHFVREHVAELLFSKEKGLGLSSYRYNIGGGGVGVGNPGRSPPTPYVSPGVYNFTADAAGNYFLLKAASYGVEQLTAFVNSAPPQMTSNGASCGGRMLGENVPAYVQYLADVLAWWRTQGVRITHVSPMNEPDNHFANLDGSPCRQEGMAVLPALRASLPGLLRKALDLASLSSIGILADETSTVPEFLPEIPLWLPYAKNHIAAVAHHDYLFADERTSRMMGAEGRALSGGREMWFTEICCFKTADEEKVGDPLALLAYGQSYDPTMIGALQLGRLIYKSFVVVGDNHFDWWTALSTSLGCNPTRNATCPSEINSHGYNDALIYYDGHHARTHNHALYITKRYHLLKHFARFIPLGSIRHEVLGGAALHRVLAFQTPTSGWTVIAMNMGAEDGVFELEYLEMGEPREAWRTSEREDWARVEVSAGEGEGGGEGGRFVLGLPRFSITTVLFG